MVSVMQPPMTAWLAKMKVTEEQRALIEQAADAKGEHIAKWCRDVLVMAAKRVVGS